jgi:K+-transporting ATPase ATPase C chain
MKLPMFDEALRQLKIAFLLLLSMSVVTGLVYPAVVTGIAQIVFPLKAAGSLLHRSGEIRGSLFIGQSFSGPQYFWGRPSATTPYPYNAESSSASNYGPMNEDYLAAVKQRVAALQQGAADNQVPVDLVTSSSSGLDPEISPFAARYQVPRIAQARGLTTDTVLKIISDTEKPRLLGVFGEPRVNVLQLNLALDDYSANKG